MLIKQAIRKLEAAGFTVSNQAGRFVATHPAAPKIVEFRRNGGELSDSYTGLRVRSPFDADDFQSDYCSGAWMNSIKSAIKLACLS